MDPPRPVVALRVSPGFGVAAESDVDGFLWPPDFPGISVAKPIVGELDLPAVMNLLLKHTEFVTNSVSNSWDSKSSQ